MGRSSGARRSTASALGSHKATLTIEKAAINDPFPTALLACMSTLPKQTSPGIDSEAAHSEESDPDQRPTKRARTEIPVSIPIVIARETLVIKRCSRNTAVSKPVAPISCANVTPYLRIHYDEGSRVLQISHQPRSPYGLFKSEISLRGNEISAKHLPLLKVATRSRDAAEEEGALYVDVAIDWETEDGWDTMRFFFELKWNQATYASRSNTQRLLSQEILDTYFPSNDRSAAGDSEKLSPQAFYEAAFIPAKTEDATLLGDIPGLIPDLFPFQRRSITWLLKREGAKWNSQTSSTLVDDFSAVSTELPLSFREAVDADNNLVYVSDLYHIVSKDVAPFRESQAGVKGGVLAEEMGLGKTVEVIALILAHKRSSCSGMVLDPYTNRQVKPTSATLIITPRTLRQQWFSELRKHAPGLSVMVYDGMKYFKGDETQLTNDLAESDVVITTYDVLQGEIHYAERPPERSMRHQRAYHRPISPLVQLSWWRVCLDEAQQIESGVSSAAKVARQIPRVNAWGITGTPVKENIKDLWGLLLFLRYEPFASSPTIWEGLVTAHKQLFKPLFNAISLRHPKHAIRDELTLPAQKRFVISMPFTAVEEQYYQAKFKQLANLCGLDHYGNPLQEGWDPELPSTVDMMKSCLAQLRRIVLHPELDPNRLLSQNRKAKPLRTIEEVLNAMIGQVEKQIRNDQRTCMVNKLRRGQFLENSPRVKEALAIWTEVLQQIEPIIVNCREQLRIDLENAKQAGIEEELDGQDDSRSEPESADGGGDLPEMESEKDVLRRRLGKARLRLLSALDIQHRAVFFIASAYFQIKSNEEMTEPNSEEFKRLEELEVESYERAKAIRQEILHEPQKKATSHMSSLRADAETQSFVEIPETKPAIVGGLESRRTGESLESLRVTLDEQATIIDEWREHVVQLLLKPLIDEEAEAEITGEEYEDSTKIQDDLMAYTLALRAAIADRQEALTGVLSERNKYETKVAERQAKIGEGHAPELMLKLLGIRNSAKPSEARGSLRGIIGDIRELVTKLRNEAAAGNDRAGVELEILKKQLLSTLGEMKEQTKVITGLERELDRFTAAMNTRVEFYRQLQAVSDAVAPAEEKEGRPDAEIICRHLYNEEVNLRRRVITAQAKHRYLLHLKSAEELKAETYFCVICQSNFTLGTLTVCGHQFCKECLMLWFEAHRTCPVCKKHLSIGMLHDITVKKRELRIHQEQQPQGQRGTKSLTRFKKSGIYSEFNDNKLEAIRSIDLPGPSYTTKVDTLIRHLIWLREEDVGAKSIIFSQFRGFLGILADAFLYHNIGFTTFDKLNGITRFKEDPGIECLLMDARAHASGLNLVNASHVFLCEPVLNTALELQAIARVHRIGQERETTVWLYLVDGTVEESIYDLSVRRRLEHISSSHQQAATNDKGKAPESASGLLDDSNLEAANSLELQQAASLSKLMNKDKELGEVIDKNDVWDCLFGRVSQENNATSSSSQGDGAPDERFNDPAVMGFLAAEAAETRIQSQAEAGPS
ncbi:SNF2 family N-terminal domain-containing protein [Xylariomycetidae sp. FL2044]|nr:SNF2 family N-terminal domain-containing protein [Xylariomycetidae sp. FL2044]